MNGPIGDEMRRGFRIIEYACIEAYVRDNAVLDTNRNLASNATYRNVQRMLGISVEWHCETIRYAEENRRVKIKQEIIQAQRAYVCDIARAHAHAEPQYTISKFKI